MPPQLLRLADAVGFVVDDHQSAVLNETQVYLTVDDLLSVLTELPAVLRRQGRVYKDRELLLAEHILGTGVDDTDNSLKERIFEYRLELGAVKTFALPLCQLLRASETRDLRFDIRARGVEVAVVQELMVRRSDLGRAALLRVLREYGHHQRTRRELPVFAVGDLRRVDLLRDSDDIRVGIDKREILAQKRCVIGFYFFFGIIFLLLRPLPDGIQLLLGHDFM